MNWKVQPLELSFPSSAAPRKTAHLAWGANLPFLKALWTHTWAIQPKTRARPRLGFVPSRASKGVFSLTFTVGERFFNQHTYCMACSQYLVGNPLSYRMDLVLSPRILFVFSATPFCSGVYAHESSCNTPLVTNQSLKVFFKNSPPRSERNALILVSNCRSTWANQAWMTASASLFFLRNRIHTYRVWSSTKTKTYSFLFKLFYSIGPIRSMWINPKEFL